MPDQLAVIVEEFLAYKATHKDPKTMTQYRSYLARLGPYMGWPLDSWPLKTNGFAKYCASMGWTRASAFKMRQNLLSFWYWCRDTGKVLGYLHILKVPKPDAPTPLKAVLTAEMVLQWDLESDLRYLALLCYFFSLRPQESIAILGSDYSAGSKAVDLECCKVMKEIGLYSRLAVYVERQKHSEVVPNVKAGSKGWVACFDETAAREIVRLAKTVETPYRMDSYQRRWKGAEMGCTLKDLRRSSLYWLGHYSQINVVQLKNHARHKSLETTSKYVRRPDVEADRGLDLDS